jgi:hypothetical protein
MESPEAPSRALTLVARSPRPDRAPRRAVLRVLDRTAESPAAAEVADRPAPPTLANALTMLIELRRRALRACGRLARAGRRLRGWGTGGRFT